MFKAFRRKRGIPIYSDEFIRLTMTAYVMVAKSAIRIGNAAEYRRASDAMHEVARTI